MSATYLINRNGHYHFRLRTPSDLLGVIPQTEIIRSLKTTDLKTAKTSALPYLHGIQQTARLLRSRFISANQAQDRLLSLLSPRAKAYPPPAKKTAQKSNTEAKHLSSVIQSYIKDKEGEWTAKTLMESKGVFRIIVDLIGDIPIDSIDRATVRTFKEHLLKLPPNVYKVYPNQSPLKVIQNIDTGKLEASPMSSTSVNKHLSRLSFLMNYCNKEGIRTGNPASGLSMKQKKRPEEERKAYSPDDILKIIKKLPQDTLKKPERYWVPMICMYSGMRLDEACQLYKEDIRQVDGIWCIDVNDSKDKKLKNLSSKRIIPVHPTLLELGFIDYLNYCNSERLWNNLKLSKVEGYSTAVGRWFQRFNRQYVTGDPLKTFHSLRHTFANPLKQLGVQDSIISELMGHANGSITTGRYGKRYQPKVLLEVIQKVDCGICME
jgi:integrase